MKKFAKREETQSEQRTEVPRAVRGYRIVNCKEAVLAVPYFSPEGKLAYLNLRIQGRGGQVAPTLPPEAITPQMRELQKKRVIRLEPVK